LERPLGEAEQEIRQRAKAWDVPLVGSFDPAACGCRLQAFWDATHPAETCFDQFLTGAVLP
jgi:hypothetical protein